MVKRVERLTIFDIPSKDLKTIITKLSLGGVFKEIDIHCKNGCLQSTQKTNGFFRYFKYDGLLKHVNFLPISLDGEQIRRVLRPFSSKGYIKFSITPVSLTLSQGKITYCTTYQKNDRGVTHPIKMKPAQIIIKKKSLKDFVAMADGYGEKRFILNKGQLNIELTGNNGNSITMTPACKLIRGKQFTFTVEQDLRPIVRTFGDIIFMNAGVFWEVGKNFLHYVALPPISRKH